MHLPLLTQALPIVAAAYGRKFGVPVQVGGTQAHTNGQVIHIPQIGDEPHAKRLAYGYLTHEAGHVRHTDFTLPRSPTPLGHFIAAILEDVRIENAMLQDYPGCRVTLDAVIDAMIAQHALAPVQATDTPPEIMGNGVLALARCRYRQQTALRDHDQAAVRVMAQVFSPRFVHRLLGLMTAIRDLQHTGDSLALAAKLVALIEAEAHAPPPQPPVPAAQPGADTGKGADPEGATPPAGTTTPDDRGPEQPHDPDTEGDPGQDDPGESHPDAGQHGENHHDAGQHGENHHDDDHHAEEQSPNQAEHNPVPPDRDATGPAAITATSLPPDGRNGPVQPLQPPGGGAALAATLAASQDELPEDVFAQVARVLNAQSLPSPTLLPTLETVHGDRVQGRFTLQRVKTHSAYLTARLQGLVQARSLTRTQPRQRGRRLASQRLYRVAVADARIFQHRDYRVHPDTALHLLVDLSGSMAEGHDTVALEAAMALALALEPLRGVSRAVTAFPGRQGQKHCVTQLLGHGEAVAAHPGNFIQQGHGGTPMTGALWYAAADLLARPEVRKVLMIITDGQPDHYESTRDLVSQARAAGIAVLGIGIQCDVSWLFPLAIRIEAVGDLQQALFRVAEQMLVT